MANSKSQAVSNYLKQVKNGEYLAAMKQGLLPTKGSLKNTALETGKDILIGVLSGGLIGAIIGKPSFAVGMLTTGVGHYSGNKLVSLFGIGIMAANGFQKNTTSTVSGLEGLDGIKERIQAYKESLSEKFYLDKIIKKKAATTATTNGVGELQYFTYDDNGHLAALDDIEQQVIDSGMQFQGQLPGEYDVMGMESEMIY